METQQIYIDGNLLPREEAKISVFDHGLLYGDGIFEGIRSYNGRVFKLEEHIDRLYNSAKAIMLKLPWTKQEIIEAILFTLRANQLQDAYIRLIITRGIGDLGLDPRKCPCPSIIIIADKIVLYPEEFYRNGLEIVSVATRKNIPDALNPAIKSLNYLNNVLAKIESTNANAMEAIMLNLDGYVTEATGMNVFIVKTYDKDSEYKAVLITPPTWVGILKGITREMVMDLAISHNIKVKEDVITRYDLYTADECFLTGTAAEIVPVIKIDGRIISDGRPGKITQKLLKEFHNITKDEGTPIYTK